MAVCFVKTAKAATTPAMIKLRVESDLRTKAMAASVANKKSASGLATSNQAPHKRYDAAYTPAAAIAGAHRCVSFPTRYTINASVANVASVDSRRSSQKLAPNGHEIAAPANVCTGPYGKVTKSTVGRA